jgi:formylmethanofuran:tetrahydromethanopterin formyltransferase
MSYLFTVVVSLIALLFRQVIKLCGRPIAFDETGIVSSMSKIESNIPSLNISTATTNCTLVPDELLESTSASLARALKCKVHIAEDLVFN